jgi:hypothetical protein
MKASRALLFGCSVVVSMAASDALAAAKAAKVSPRNNPPMVRMPRIPGGDILIDQQPNAVNGYFADTDCQLCPTGQQSMADNFVINSATGSAQLQHITMWGGYFPGNTPNATDDYDILIHNNAGTLPGPTIVFTVSGIQATTRATTGVVLFGVDEWVFDFDLATERHLLAGDLQQHRSHAGRGLLLGDRHPRPDPRDRQRRFLHVDSRPDRGLEREPR